MRASWLDRPWHLRVAALGLAAVLVWLARVLAPGAAPLIEEGVGDLAWRIAARPEVERRVVVVDIDERSVQAHGAWPWPRETVARLVDRLHEAGVAVQALDIVFPEAKPGDDALAAALQRSGAVVGQIFSLDPAAAPEVGQAAGPVGDTCASGLPQSSGLVGNAASLLSPGMAAGHLTPALESDGVVRRIPALICHRGKPYATLALAALAQAAGASQRHAASGWRLHSATSAGARYPGFWSPAQWLSSTALPGVTVALDERGALRVPYARQREALLSVSADYVLAGKADRSLLGGAVALIGATAFGIGDTVATPLSAVASGVEVHAQLAAGLLDGRVVYTPAAAPWLQAAAMLVVAAVLLLVCARRRAADGATAARGLPVLPSAGVLLALACAALGAAAPSQWNLWLPWSAAALFALFGAGVLALTEHALTRAQRERLSAHLGAYLPAPMAARLAAIDPSGHLEAERREVTVLVADIRNFSAYAAHRPAEQTAAVLHAFSCIAVEVVERHGGVVENIVGDQVVAMWNAYGGNGGASPQQAAGQARQAVDAARELMQASQDLLAAAPGDGREASAVQPLALGIGLECGDAIVGSFGPARRRTHAALGEPVTVAVRLQAMTQELSLPILIGPRLAAGLPAADTVSQGEYLLEGLSRHCELFAPAAWATWTGPALVVPAPRSLAADAESSHAGDADPGLALGGSPSLLSAARATGDL